MQKLKNKLVILAAFLPFLTFAIPVNLAYAADSPAKSAIQQGACDASGQTNCDPAQAASSLDNTIQSIINILSIIVGIVAVIMLIIGGFRYITSSGSAEGVSSAKRTMLYAIIGLIIVALAQVIVRFVLVHTTSTAS